MTDTGNLRERIRKAVERGLGVEIDAEDFAAGERLDDFLGLDSIAAMEILVALEKEFDLVFDAAFFSTEKLGDLKSLEAYLGNRR